MAPPEARGLRVLGSRRCYRAGRCVTALLCFFLFASSGYAGKLVEGIQDGQVFPYQTYQAEIPFRAKVKGELKARVVDDFTEKGIAWGHWDIVDKGQAEATPRPGVDEPVRTSNRDLKIPAVPIGGEYTIQFTHEGQTEQYKAILVGEIWVVGGGTNAIGARTAKKVDAIPWVRVFRNGRWQEGSDPVIPSPDGSSRWSSPWLRAAQNFYQFQGIPVGLIGYGRPGGEIETFVDGAGKLATPLRMQLERYAQGASALFWWQGEADAVARDIEGYQRRLAALVKGVREATGRNSMLATVVQLGAHNVSASQDTPYFGRVREAQRQYVLSDPAALLVPTVSYPVASGYEVADRGVQKLSLILGEALREINVKRKVEWFGPKLKQASFVDRSGYRKVRLQFDMPEDHKLVIGRDLHEDFLITDAKHQGYAELTGAPRVEGDQIVFSVAGASIGRLQTASQSKVGKVALVDSGYVKVVQVSLRKGDTELLLDLAQPTQLGARLHFCLMGKASGDVRDSKGRHLCAFSDVEIVKAPEQF